MMDQATRRYEESVRSLQAASAGRFPGAAIPSSELRQAAGTLAGLDTSVLRREAQVARGTSTPGSTEKWWSVVMPILQSIAGGMLAEGISATIKNWLQRVDDATSADQAAQDCADSIDAVVDSADAASAALCERLSESIASICQALEMINPREQQALAQQLVMMGTGLINTVGQQLVGMCADRDQAVGRCFDDLITHASSLCDAAPQPPTPQCQPSCEPAQHTPPTQETQGGVPGGTAPSATNPPGQPVPAPVSPAPPTPPAPSAPPVAPQPSVGPPHCPPVDVSEAAGETHAAQVSGAAGGMCAIGAVQASGMGVISAAGALLADVAAQATAQMIGGVEMGIQAALSVDTQCPPAPPEPETCPPEPCPPALPESSPPQPSPPESSPPGEDLSKVPEPEPPAEKVRMMAEQQAASSAHASDSAGSERSETQNTTPEQSVAESSSTPAHSGEKAPEPGSDGTKREPSAAADPKITARKAGAW